MLSDQTLRRRSGSEVDATPLRALRVGGSGRFVGGEFAVEVGRGDSAVDEKVATADERPFRTHEERADGSDFVWGAAAPGGAELDHTSVSLTARTGEFVPG